MSLASQISALASRVATEIKALVRPDHPGLARAWVSFGYIGGAIQISAAYNVSGVTRLSTGRYRITFATPFSTANYCWLAFSRTTNDSNVYRAMIRPSTDAKTSAYVEVVSGRDNQTLSDTSEMNLVVYN
jgi:hypothetical protein